MKLKIFALCLLAAIGFNLQAAQPRHMHASVEKADSKKMVMPGYCEIEIINRSFEPVHVSGQFLDGIYLTPFDIYPYDTPHYISVYYYGCQSGMYLTVENFGGYVMYSGFAPVYQTIVIYPTFGNKQSAVKTTAKR